MKGSPSPPPVGSGPDFMMDPKFIIMVIKLFVFVILLPVVVLFYFNKVFVKLYKDKGSRFSEVMFLFIIDNIICMTILTIVVIATGEFPQGMITAITISLVNSAVAVGAGVVKKSPKTQRGGVFGNQRWANKQDIVVSGLANPKPSLVLGLQDKILVGPEQETDWHTILVGGAGTGKTSCGIMPTVLNFQGSAFVLDIKGEIEEATRAAREQIGPVYVINPTQEDTWSYNPIQACDPSPQGINECQEIGRQLVPYPPGGPGQNQWVYDGARGLVSALAYIVAIDEGTLRDVAYNLTTLSYQNLVTLIDSADDTARMMASSFMVTDDKIKGYYISQASDFLRSFALDHELVRVTTSADKEFTFDMLESPCTVYLQVPEQKLQQSADLFRLIFMQLLRHLQARGERQQPHVLVCLDEFPQLGNIPQLPEMLATLRSRNVHIMLAGQSIADIDEKYQQTTRRRIVDNCNYVSIFSAVDPESQKYFSDMIGQQTVISQSGGTSDSTSKGTIGGSSGQNRGWQETGQPLLRPEELKNLGNEVVVIARQTWPLRLQKAFYKNL